jgi:hypothetical protein
LVLASTHPKEVSTAPHVFAPKVFPLCGGLAHYRAGHGKGGNSRNCAGPSGGDRRNSAALGADRRKVNGTGSRIFGHGDAGNRYQRVNRNRNATVLFRKEPRQDKVVQHKRQGGFVKRHTARIDRRRA